MNEKEQVTKIETVQAGLTSSWKGYKKKKWLQRTGGQFLSMCAFKTYVNNNYFKYLNVPTIKIPLNNTADDNLDASQKKHITS